MGSVRTDRKKKEKKKKTETNPGQRLNICLSLLIWQKMSFWKKRQESKMKITIRYRSTFNQRKNVLVEFKGNSFVRTAGT